MSAPTDLLEHAAHRYLSALVLLGVHEGRIAPGKLYGAVGIAGGGRPGADGCPPLRWMSERKGVAYRPDGFVPWTDLHAVAAVSLDDESADELSFAYRVFADHRTMFHYSNRRPSQREVLAVDAVATDAEREIRRLTTVAVDRGLSTLAGPVYQPELFGVSA
jgi:hypothetical protein